MTQAPWLGASAVFLSALSIINRNDPAPEIPDLFQLLVQRLSLGLQAFQCLLHSPPPIIRMLNKHSDYKPNKKICQICPYFCRRPLNRKKLSDFFRESPLH